MNYRVIDLGVNGRAVREGGASARAATDLVPQWAPDQFADFFCSTHRGCAPNAEVTRIEWRHVDGGHR